MQDNRFNTSNNEQQINNTPQEVSSNLLLQIMQEMYPENANYQAGNLLVPPPPQPDPPSAPPMVGRGESNYLLLDTTEETNAVIKINHLVKSSRNTISKTS